MANLPMMDGFASPEHIKEVIDQYKDQSYDDLSKLKRATRWMQPKPPERDDFETHEMFVKAQDAYRSKGRLPICPYGCDREGTLLEIVMGTDGRAMGIFNDHPCSCVFIADIQLGDEPPTTKKMEIGPNGDYQEVDA